MLTNNFQISQKTTIYIWYILDVHSRLAGASYHCKYRGPRLKDPRPHCRSPCQRENYALDGLTSSVKCSINIPST